MSLSEISTGANIHLQNKHWGGGGVKRHTRNKLWGLMSRLHFQLGEKCPFVHIFLGGGGGGGRGEQMSDGVEGEGGQTSGDHHRTTPWNG